MSETGIRYDSHKSNNVILTVKLMSGKAVSDDAMAKIFNNWINNCEDFVCFGVS